MSTVTGTRGSALPACASALACAARARAASALDIASTSEASESAVDRRARPWDRAPGPLPPPRWKPPPPPPPR